MPHRPYYFDDRGQYKTAVGIDHNAVHILKAQQTFGQENIQFIHGEASEYLQQNKKTFDVLILSHLPEHLDEPAPFLKNFKKYFRFIYIEGPDFETTHLNIYRHELGCTLTYTDNDHIREFDRIAIKALLKNAGLEIIDQEFRFGIQKFWCGVATS